MQLKQDPAGYVHMSRRFPSSTRISITFTDGSTGEYSGVKMNELYDQALADFRLGNNMDAKGFDRNAKNIHRRNAVDYVPVQAGMPA